MQPVLSVVVPTFRRPRLLQRAVKSALGQTFSDLEVIVVNDDPEKPVSLQVNDERVRLVTNTRARGACGARNTGLELAKGRYFTTLDDDDEFSPTRLELLLKSYASRYSFISSAIVAVGQSIETTCFKRRRVIDLPSVLWGNCCGPTGLAETERLKALGGYDETLTSAQDWDLWIRMIERWGPALRTGEPTYRQHIAHGGERITSGPRKLEGMIRLLHKHRGKMTESQVEWQMLHISKQAGALSPLAVARVLTRPSVAVHYIKKSLGVW